MKSEPRTTLLLSRSEVEEFLPMSACIAAVEAAFVAHARGSTIAPGVLGAHVPGGGFHVKTAGLTATRAYFAAKVNANFPDNPRRLQLPTIQGALVLFDANNGSPLAIMDSAEVTRLRTAAASAVAGKFLARPDSTVMTICGCGVQGRAHLEALRLVRPIRSVFAYDVDEKAAVAFAAEMSSPDLEILPAASLRSATSRSDIVITCTAARQAFLGFSDVRPGTFVAAVGADSENKQELEPDFLRRATVIVDVLEQCATIGDLHHAIEAGLLTREDVRADLAAVVSGNIVGRGHEDEIVIFDSTGTALEDVAAAAWAYERARAANRGREIDLTA